MQFILTFLAYFLLGLMVGTIFSHQVKVVMDGAIVPAVENLYTLAKDEIMKSKETKKLQKISSTIEIKPKKSSQTPKPIGLDKLGYEVYEDDQGYYVIDEENTNVPVLESEIVEFYSE